MRQIRFQYRHLLVLISLLLAIGCTSEEDTFDYTVITTNSTTSNLEISLYDSGELFESNTLAPNENTECTYQLPSFQGYGKCSQSNSSSIDSIIFRFGNGKGYICALTGLQSSNVNCFPGKFLFGRDEATFKELGDNEFEFEITQDDFDNAFDLPE